MQKNSYYPAVYPEEIWGLLHGGKNTIATNRYLYNGKELQSMTITKKSAFIFLLMLNKYSPKKRNFAEKQIVWKQRS